MAKIQQIAGMRQTPKFDNPFAGTYEYLADRDKEDKLLQRQELLDKRYEENLKYQRDQDARANKLADQKEAERQAGINAIKNYGTTVVKNRPQMYIDQKLEETNQDVINQYDMYQKANPDKPGGFELKPKQNQMYDNIFEAQAGEEGLKEMQHEVMDPRDYANRVFDFVREKTGDIQKATLASEQAYKQYAIPETKKDTTLLKAQDKNIERDFDQRQKLLDKLKKNNSSKDSSSGSTKYNKLLDAKTSLLKEVDDNYGEWTATLGTIEADKLRNYVIQNVDKYGPSAFRYAMRVGDTGGENDAWTRFSKGIDKEKFLKTLDDVYRDPSKIAINNSDASLTNEEYKTASENLRKERSDYQNKYYNALANASGKVAQPTDADEMLKIRSILNRGMDGSAYSAALQTSGSEVASANASQSPSSGSRVPVKQKIVDKYIKQEEEKKNPETIVATNDESKDVIKKAKSGFQSRWSERNDYEPIVETKKDEKKDISYKHVDRWSNKNSVQNDSVDKKIEENKKLTDEFKKKKELGIPYTSDLESGAREKLEDIRSFVNDDNVDLTDNKARGNAIANYMDPEKKYGVGPTLWDEWMMARDESSKKRAEKRMIAQQDTLQKKRELVKKIEEMAKRENRYR